jgi:aminoglycoside 2''-phosphotransferase
MKEPDWRKIEFEMSALSIRTARFLGEGWTSRAYLVNNELVFRFPKQAEDWLELEREIAFLSFASTSLSLAVPDYLRQPLNRLPHLTGTRFIGI